MVRTDGKKCPCGSFVTTVYWCFHIVLQDVLENDDIKLDKLFKSSLISDLANVSIISSFFLTLFSRDEPVTVSFAYHLPLPNCD